MEKNKKIEIYKNLILDVPGVNSAQFDKSIESSVTTSWGVNWDADFIARDILQNFRDSNLSEIEKVVVNERVLTSHAVDILYSCTALEFESITYTLVPSVLKANPFTPTCAPEDNVLKLLLNVDVPAVDTS